LTLLAIICHLFVSHLEAKTIKSSSKSLLTTKILQTDPKT